jgi:hypothetical protein
MMEIDTDSGAILHTFERQECKNSGSSASNMDLQNKQMLRMPSMAPPRLMPVPGIAGSPERQAIQATDWRSVQLIHPDHACIS